ncbi:hypothetical protein A2U01_0063990, partial [Trifolium medium]|nr:hypothetical protein [Trifolium medium]
VAYGYCQWCCAEPCCLHTSTYVTCAQLASGPVLPIQFVVSTIGHFVSAISSMSSLQKSPRVVHQNLATF